MKSICLYLFCIIHISFSLSKSLTRKLESQIPSPEYQALITWMTENGAYVSPKFQPIEKDNFNRYIITKEKISKKEEILFVPNNICISYVHSLVNPLCRPIGWYEDPETLFDCITYFIAVDQYNKKSFFSPYYNYLPDLDPEYYIVGFPKAPENQKLFQLTQLESERTSCEYYMNESKQRLERFLPKQITEQEFMKSFLYVASRNFGRRGSDFFPELNNLVPYLDLFNHFNDHNTHYYYNDKRDGYILFALRDILPGEEITVSYGKITNSHLLGAYGFVLKNNKYKSSYDLKIGNEIFNLNMFNTPEQRLNNVMHFKFRDDNVQKKQWLQELQIELKKRIDELMDIRKNIQME